MGFEVTGKKRGKRGCINNPERKITASWPSQYKCRDCNQLPLVMWSCYVKNWELTQEAWADGCTVIAFWSLPLFISLKILNGSKIKSGSWNKDPACLFLEDVGSSHKDLKVFKGGRHLRNSSSKGTSSLWAPKTRRETTGLAPAFFTS